MKFLFALVLATTIHAAERSKLSSIHVPMSDSTVESGELRDLDVRQKTDSGFEVIVPANNADAFLKSHPSARLIEKDIHDVFDRKDLENPEWRKGYRNWDSIQSELADLAKQHPQILSIENYGTSEEGRPLTAVKITGPNKVPKNANIPELLITSATHGNEITTPELVMTLINKLAEGYGTDSRFTAMIDKHVLYFIPAVCPDGYAHEDRYIQGLDPNRDYAYPDDPSHQSVGTIASEIKWVATKHLASSIDIHSDAAMVMYPWAYTMDSLPTEEVAQFTAVGDPMGQDLGFPVGQISHIIYVAVGSSADYWYWKNKTLAFGLEMNGGQQPDASQIESIVSHHVEAMWHYIERF